MNGVLSCPKVLKVKDVQSILQIGQVAAYRLIHSGEFPVIRVGRRRSPAGTCRSHRSHIFGRSGIRPCGDREYRPQRSWRIWTKVCSFYFLPLVTPPVFSFIRIQESSTTPICRLISTTCKPMGGWIRREDFLPRASTTSSWC